MSNLKDQTEAARNIFTLGRDAFLALILMMLVGCPSAINQRLKDAGLDYVKGPGFEWKNKVEEAEAKTEEVQQELSATKTKLEQTLNAVREIEANNPSLRAETRPIISQTEDTLRNIDAAQFRVERSLQEQRALIMDIEASELER